ncbi:MAG: DMT family transporter [Acidimicrobiaceae bacterium]|nr:DMT family transporter [Acidimicrobiaceae bacterium]
MTIVFALLSALANAVNVSTQHIASTSYPRKSKGWQLVVYLFKNPLWLFGWAALAAAFVFQALALHAGQLSVVQPLLVTELVFALVLRRVWIQQAIRPVTWWSAALTGVSLSLFIAMSEPHGGHTSASSGTWIVASAAMVASAALLTLLGRAGVPARRAALTASATGIMWALVATYIRAADETVSEFGAAGLFTHWPVYALIAAGSSAVILDQTAIHVGPLSMSQPFLVIVDPIVSVVLSVWIFAEYFTADALRLTLAVLAFAAMCVAVTVLTRTAPATMEPTSATATAPGDA